MTPTGDLSRCWKVVSMETDGSASHLNPSQALHLLTSARYADNLFADIESVLFASKSKSPFREYKNSFPPAQIKVIEDYLARIRAQLVRMLEAQGIALPEPEKIGRASC